MSVTFVVISVVLLCFRPIFPFSSFQPFLFIGGFDSRALCRSRRELSNAYVLAKFGFDTAENGPSKVRAQPPASTALLHNNDPRQRRSRGSCTVSTPSAWSRTTPRISWSTEACSWRGCRTARTLTNQRWSWPSARTRCPSTTASARARRSWTSPGRGLARRSGRLTSPRTLSASFFRNFSRIHSSALFEIYQYQALHLLEWRRSSLVIRARARTASLATTACAAFWIAGFLIHHCSVIFLF